jgi:hypothetical protein
VREAVVVCVSPPLDGLPLPYVPVKVRVYVVFVVVTVVMTITLLDPVVTVGANEMGV